MKTHKIIFRNILIAISAIVIGIRFTAAQNATAPKEKMSTSIQLAFLKKADHSKHILVKVSAKTKDNKREAAQNAHINFYAQNKDGQKIIGKCETSNEGKADFILPKDLPIDTGMTYHIIAKIESDEAYDNSDEEVRFKDVNLTVKFNVADTNRVVTASVMAIGNDGSETPVKDITLKFYVQRMFGNMAAAEDNSLNTDENGVAIFNYPKDVSGGKNGQITVVAKIEDNEQFGTVETNADVSWGNIVPAEVNPFPRALWEPYAPPSLVIVICVLFGGVWSTYIYIFYNMYKIKKDKNASQLELEEAANQ